MSTDPGWIAIGELTRRAGVAASALRFYEAQGLISGARTAGRHRQYPRHVLRRVSFIRAAQAVGLGLAEIREALSGLPDARTPTKADWERLARSWQPLLDARIAALTALRDQLGACIGCGCLSLKSCALYNPQDAAGRRGPGARYLAGERPPRPRATSP
ncbi:redox-sensitive transcriptional activator SoxR [Ideonella sp. A 288]|uniref:redox-sensitive transcriptional activator SoxR n=1 Tax=Ideonella sp. A 288 TaxID=1962181 RepID=UPI000B4AF888|nr:redox-sensitive transcriptional activator SoxR [Ideonella sp. A 288]